MSEAALSTSRVALALKRVLTATPQRRIRSARGCSDAVGSDGLAVSCRQQPRRMPSGVGQQSPSMPLQPEKSAHRAEPEASGGMSQHGRNDPSTVGQQLPCTSAAPHSGWAEQDALPDKDERAGRGASRDRIARIAPSANVARCERPRQMPEERPRLAESCTAT